MTILILLLPAAGFSQIVISGEILNYEGSSIVYINHAMEGVRPYQGESAKITPKPNGKFRYKFDNPGIATLSIFYEGVMYIFVHDSEDEISLLIDQEKIISVYQKSELVRNSVRQEALVSHDAKYRVFNEFLNAQPRTAFSTTQSMSGNLYSRPLADRHDPEDFMSYYDSLKSRELIELQRVWTLLPERQDDQMSEIRDFLAMEIESFYSSVIMNALFLKRIRQVVALRKNQDTTLASYHPGWEKVAEQIFNHLEESPQYPNSVSYNELVQSVNYALRTYKQYYRSENRPTWDEIIVTELLQPDFPADSLITFDDKMLFSMQMTNLRQYSNSQQFYSPVLAQAIDSMKKWHPDSPHLERLEPNFSKVDAYLQSITSPYNEAVIIEENYTSLNSLLEKFRGKTVLIDVWATWCHPCIGEFAYKNNLKDLIRDEDLEVLYISIDKAKWEDRWRENINYNQLEGYHILADEVLIMDMWETLGAPKGSIPRYALVAPDGSIVVPNAARPSMGDALRDQILEIVPE